MNDRMCENSSSTTCFVRFFNLLVGRVLLCDFSIYFLSPVTYSNILYSDWKIARFFEVNDVLYILTDNVIPQHVLMIVWNTHWVQDRRTITANEMSDYVHLPYSAASYGIGD